MGEEGARGWRVRTQSWRRETSAFRAESRYVTLCGGDSDSSSPRPDSWERMNTCSLSRI